jgi:hypothetical protein
MDPCYRRRLSSDTESNGECHHIIVTAVILFWSEVDQEVRMAVFFTTPSEEAMKKLLNLCLLITIVVLCQA